MDDLHGAGDPENVCKFTVDLQERISLRGGAPNDLGVTYQHLKRMRRRHDGYTELWANDRYLNYVLCLLGLEECKAAPTPSVATARATGAAGAPVDAATATLCRSCVGALAYYAQGRDDA